MPLSHSQHLILVTSHEFIHSAQTGTSAGTVSLCDSLTMVQSLLGVWLPCNVTASFSEINAYIYLFWDRNNIKRGGNNSIFQTLTISSFNLFLKALSKQGPYQLKRNRVWIICISLLNRSGLVKKHWKRTYLY